VEAGISCERRATRAEEESGRDVEEDRCFMKSGRRRNNWGWVEGGMVWGSLVTAWRMVGREV
jgi:hypothetical protein